MNETDSPKDEDKDYKEDWQQEAAHHLGQGELHNVFRRCLFFLSLFNFFQRLDFLHPHSCFRNNLGLSFTLEHLISGIKDHLEERDCHDEEHPDVGHLDIRCDRQALEEAQEAKTKYSSDPGPIIVYPCQSLTTSLTAL